MKMKWNAITNHSDVSQLPPEGKYVLAMHNRGTWKDEEDPINVNCIVVKLIKGVSEEGRQKMQNGLMPDPFIKSYNGFFEPVFHNRSKIYRPEDQHGNNGYPYYWDQFGPDSFFGQDIIKWCELPEDQNEI